tara:strand:- start:677 stop:3787 length:3111 start_codon:yes stop_codon:yes gene_type:complete
VIATLFSCGRNNDTAKNITSSDSAKNCSQTSKPSYSSSNTTDLPLGSPGDTHTISCADGYAGGGTWTCSETGSWEGKLCGIHFSQEQGNYKDGTEDGEYMEESYAKENVSCNGESVDFPDHSMVLKFDLSVSSTIALSTRETSWGESYKHDFYVDWGDDSCEHNTLSHTYDDNFISSLNDQVVTVKLIGRVDVWGSDTSANYNQTLKEVVNLGDLQWRALSAAFMDTTNLTSFTAGHTNTENIPSMSKMFKNATSLTYANFDNVNTSLATSMEEMFSGAQNLSSLDLSMFNTSNVTLMDFMFQSMNELTSLNLSGFDTSKVMSMEGMFRQTWALTSLNLTNFNTKNVYSMSQMFQGAKSLAKLDLDSFNTSNVVDMSDMFSGMEELETINLSKFNTAKVLSMGSMFSGLKRLKVLDLSSFDTSMTAIMDYMFTNMEGIEEINFGNWEESAYLSTTASILGGAWETVPPKIYCVSPPFSIASCDSTPPMVVTFETTQADQSVSLGITGGSISVNWGDNSQNTNTTHTYSTPGKYQVWVSGVNSITGLTNTWSDNLISINTLGDISSISSISSPFEGHSGLKTVSGYSNLPNTITSLNSFLKNTNSLEYVDITNMDFGSITDADEFLSGAVKLNHVNLGNKFSSIASKDNVFSSTQITGSNENKILFCTKDYDDNLGTSDLPQNWTVSLGEGEYQCENTLIPIVIEVEPDNTIPFSLNTLSNKILVDWGDSSARTYWQKTKDYGTTTAKKVKIWGAFIASSPGVNDRDKIKGITSFGHHVFVNANLAFKNTSITNASGYGRFGPINLTSMFYQCSSLTSANFSNFQTDQITGMGNMFSNVTSLTSLDLTSFNTENVTSMLDMFRSMSDLTSIDLSSFKTDKVKSMRGMFANTSSLSNLDLTSFNTSRVEAFKEMFRGMKEMRDLNVSSFDTSNGTDFRQMFADMQKITSLDISNFDTSSASMQLASMLTDLPAISDLNLGFIESEEIIDSSFLSNSGNPTFTSSGENPGLTCLNKDDPNNPDDYIINIEGSLYSCDGN